MSEVDIYKGMIKKMKDDEIKDYKEAVLQLQTAYDFHNSKNLAPYNVDWESVRLILDYITNLQQKEELFEKIVYKYDELKQENERLKHEVAKLHIIQEEYGNYIENTHIIDDYQKTYFMTNKYLIELKNGKFVYVDELNDKYEDYKSRCEKVDRYIKKEIKDMPVNGCRIRLEEVLNILNGRSDE